MGKLLLQRSVFKLTLPYNNLSSDHCATILKGIAKAAGLDTTIFMAHTFCKSGIMVGIRTGIELDALFHLGGWCTPAEPVAVRPNC